MTGRRASDWLTTNLRRANESDPGGERRARERRDADRRAPRRKVDPVFVVTLVNQIMPDEPPSAPAALKGYAAAPSLARPRAGVMANFRI
ncbi:MAG: hypothetical protein AB7O04_09630 [Hyphomonadaceae bacterium]